MEGKSYPNLYSAKHDNNLYCIQYPRLNPERISPIAHSILSSFQNEKLDNCDNIITFYFVIGCLARIRTIMNNFS